MNTDQTPAVDDAAEEAPKPIKVYRPFAPLADPAAERTERTREVVNATKRLSAALADPKRLHTVRQYTGWLTRSTIRLQEAGPDAAAHKALRAAKPVLAAGKAYLKTL